MNLAIIHSRYGQVLQKTKEGVSLSKACQVAGHGVQTIRDSMGIAELKIVSGKQYDSVLDSVKESIISGEKITVKDMEQMCRSKLSAANRKERMVTYRLQGKLLPISTKIYDA